MTVSYKKLWKLLIDKDLCKATGMSSFTLAKMSRGENVSMDVLKRICEVLQCDVGDIIEFQLPAREKETAQCA